ncbi:MAG: GMC family oxidoreductase [Rivularia sp. (in: Bacteria)]|nr:GMC family oxidoreductase [Rivularia sp. MS3]
MQQYYGIIIIGTAAVVMSLLYNSLLPSALANCSGMVGCNLVKHITTEGYAISPVKKETVLQKKLAINDFYFDLLEDAKTLEHEWQIMRLYFHRWLLNSLLKVFANLSVDWLMRSEDLPNVENRVEIAKNKPIKVYYRSNNQKAHLCLQHQFEKILCKAVSLLVSGMSVQLKMMNYQGGTRRFASDSTVDVFDLNCRTHDIDNIYVVDSSFFPSIGTMNPILNIVANALKVAEHLKKKIEYKFRC